MLTDKKKAAIQRRLSENAPYLTPGEWYHEDVPILLREIDILEKERDLAIGDLGSNCYACLNWEIFGAQCKLSDRKDFSSCCKNYKWRGFTDRPPTSEAEG